MFTWHRGRLRMVCERREFLRVGAGLMAAGLTLPACWTSAAAAAPEPAEDRIASRRRGRAKSCILLYLLGGPPQLDMFDLKPEAPAEIRGPFRPIATNVPGLQICEHLPQLARMADRYALLRAVSHRNSNHTPMIYYTLTGRHTALPAQDNDIRPPQRDDFPHMGSVIARFLDTDNQLPAYIALPELAIRSSTSGQYQRARLPLRGGSAGFLGARYDPLAVNGPPGSMAAVPALCLPDEVGADRFERRTHLLKLLDGKLSMRETRTMQHLRQQAVVLTGSSSQGRLQVFSLDDERPTTRDRYGRHRLGQTMLLARRLSEAGVPMIAIHFNEMTLCDGWDTHSNNFEACQQELLPMLDQSLSALLEDLHERNLLDETLVVCMGEFGRTPKINAAAGRDHWGECSSALLAGGGIQGGVVHGHSDAHAAYPLADKVDPVDVQATIYHCLGLNTRQLIYDELARPFEISAGTPITAIL